MQVSGEVAADDDEYFPAGHSRHCSNDVAPSVVRYVPAGQEEHFTEPDSAYVPARQNSHDSKPSAPGEFDALP